MADLTVAEVRKYSEDHYNNGGDVVVECWNDRDIEEFIEDGGTVEQLERLFAISDERREYKEVKPVE